MKLIIDVPEEVCEALKGITEDSTSLDPYSLADIIVNKSEVIEELKPQGDLISREALKKALLDAYKEYDGYEPNDLARFAERVDNAIDNAPTVQPEYFPPCEDCNKKMEKIRRAYDKAKAMERPQGEWGEPFETYGRIFHTCSHCHISSRVILFDNFCPNCGADMRKEGAE